MEEGNKTTKIGVRELADFCCRRGDLGGDANGEGMPSINGQQGIQVHQKIQNRYKGLADAEVSIKETFEFETIDILLSGRIDLLFTHETPKRIEEIKTVYSFQKEWDNRQSSHWAQLKCYAALYIRLNPADELKLSLNHVSLFNHQEHRIEEIWQSEELESFLQACLQQYYDWQRLVGQQRHVTMDTANKLEFPFAKFRPQQRQFAAQVFRAIKTPHRLMVEAPTGSGKTISTLFPSIKALGSDDCDQIVYLSAKTSGQKQAIETVEQLIDNGLEISYLQIQAKAKACPCNVNIEEINEGGQCLRCIGFYDRLSVAREELLSSRKMTIEAIQNCAKKHQLCPFELSLQMMPWADIVVCDLNYVFDPLVQLSYFHTNPQRKVLLIDELHNLVDRARNMYSGFIERQHFRQAIKAKNNANTGLAIKSFQEKFIQHLKSCEVEINIEDGIPDKLIHASYLFIEKLGVELFSNKLIAAETMDLAKAVIRFQKISQLYDEHHRTISISPITEKNYSSQEIKLQCLNAFEYLNHIFDLFRSVCGFSATLAPIGYFHQALGLGENTYQLKLASSFSAENLQVCVGSFVDTRYQYRASSITPICHSIHRSYAIKPGNYLVFFSSYQYMLDVHSRFEQLFPRQTTFIQKRNANDNEREEFLAQFFDSNNSLGFAIMGGIFAEGIDYRGNALIGSIVVGPGLPHPSAEQKLIEQDFNQLSLNGFDHAYLYPGLIRVQQSAGRVIRSETDKGVIILLDRRFTQPAYRSLLPNYWSVEDCSSLDQLEVSLQAFWKRAE